MLLNEFIEQYKIGISQDVLIEKIGISEFSYSGFIAGLRACGVITEQIDKSRKSITLEKSAKKRKKTINKKKKDDVSNTLTEEYLFEKYVVCNHTTKEIAEELGVTNKRIANLITKYGLRKNEHDLDLKLSGMFESLEQDIDYFDYVESVVDIVDNLKTQDLIQFTENRLTEKEADIIVDYYGRYKTLNDIAVSYDVSHERIRQVIAKGIRKIYASIFCKCVARSDCENYTNSIFNKEISDLIGVRGINALRRAGIFDLKDISSREQLFRIRNLGIKTANRIIETMSKTGIEIE